MCSYGLSKKKEGAMSRCGAKLQSPMMWRDDWNQLHWCKLNCFYFCIFLFLLYFLFIFLIFISQLFLFLFLFLSYFFISGDSFGQCSVGIWEEMIPFHITPKGRASIIVTGFSEKMDVSEAVGTYGSESYSTDSGGDRAVLEQQ